jgi:hypothetical protein
MDQRVFSSLSAIIKEVFWRRAVALVAGLSTISFFISLLRHTVFASFNLNWKVAEWVLSWHWQAWVALWSVVWIFVILKGAVDTVHRREKLLATSEENLKKLNSDLESERDTIRKLRSELSEQQTRLARLESENRALATKADTAGQLVNLSLSLRTEETPQAILMGTGRDSLGQPFQVHVTEMTLLIYSHGDKPVVLRRCKLWKLHATEQIREIPLHEVATLTSPVCVNVTEPLVRVISESPTLDFTSLQGKYTIRIVITYCQGVTTEDAEPRDFQLVCKPWRGSGTLRIDANEIPAQQS